MQTVEADEGFADIAGSVALGVFLAAALQSWTLMVGNGAGKASGFIFVSLLDGDENGEKESLRLESAGTAAWWVA